MFDFDKKYFVIYVIKKRFTVKRLSGSEESLLLLESYVEFAIFEKVKTSISFRLKEEFGGICTVIFFFFFFAPNTAFKRK